MKELQTYPGWDELFYFSLDTPGYKVSNYGRVLSTDRQIIRKSGRKQTFKERILKQQLDDHGYPCVTLRIKGKKYVFDVHRLVAKCFVINYDHKPIINHKDGIKTNNYYKNLEWCTHSENLIHAYQNHLR